MANRKERRKRLITWPCEICEFINVQPFKKQFIMCCIHYGGSINPKEDLKVK
jgi:hypothetical protein